MQRARVRHAAGANSAAAIGAQLKAGTNCGSCIPELKRLIAQANADGVAADSGQRQLAAAASKMFPAMKSFSIGARFDEGVDS